MEDIKIIDIKSDRYPELLKKIANPPKIIYVKGEIYPKENCFAIVGSRNSSLYGEQVASKISGDLSELGVIIVSGLAQGIDAAAQQAAVRKKKRTIGVLGTGLDDESFYPKENLGLVKEIIENNGCLISEYPSGTRGSRFSFPQRNRIISGLSLGILVVEAKEKSGSLIAAQWAKKQERKIFSVPGNIYSSNSRGTNFLIKNGAILTESAKDILKELKIA